ncbi:MAG: PEP-utilizing enzyme [Patescibacteria group bacterium]|nr:PEP-utilizing enzyme [Patescibacteria group bacterium]MDD4611306.1 PEP-utilizing enzyme [Patescibacteria group bacterium]
MKLNYIQRKSAVSSILWILGCGLGMTYYPIKKVYAGFDLGNTIWLCRKGDGYICGDQTTRIDKLIMNFQKYILRHHRHTEMIKKIYLYRATKFREFIKNQLAVCDFTRVSNKALWHDYREVIKGYREVYPYGEPFAIAIGNLSDKIKADFFKKGITSEEFEKILLPHELSFLQREQIDFFRIALDNHGKKLTDNTRKELQRHYDKYTWVPYDYGVTNYSLDYFLNQLSALLEKDRAELKNKYQALKNYSKSLKKEQWQIIRKYKLSSHDQSLINIISTAFYLVDSKKELFTQCHWYAERLFTEISSRLALPGHLMRYLLPEEVESCLNGNKKISLKKIQSRYNNCVLIISSNGKVNIIEGKRAKQIIDDFFRSRSRLVSEAEVKGRTAYPGLARGLIHVIQDARECNTFKHGEILVTAMTSPDYMIAARRAAAIVTDEGGITCHAAIVARELNIPCIIGTKIATKVLKDGDLVEVDADKGIVKILK